jgi:hypothetical protein
MLLGSLGATAQQLDEKGATSLYGILTGSTYNQIKALHDDYKSLAATLDSQLAAIQRISDPATRAQAQQIYDQANASLTKQFQIYVQLRDSYNDAVRQISVASFGFAVPKTASFSGLGVLPAVVFAGMTLTQIFVAAGLTIALLWAITDLVGSFKTQSGTTQRYTNQLAQVLDAAGAVFEHAGTGAKNLSSGALNIAYAAAIGVGVFLAFKLLSKKKSSSSTTIELKPVSGTEIKALAAPVGA